MYLSRAEKTALGHDLPEIYKVQFAIQGLENQVKAKVISKEPKTFQELRHAVSLAKAQLECNTTEDMNNLTLVALAAQLKDSLKAEISALTQSNCQSKNGQPEPWSKPPNPHPQWQQFAPPPPGYSVPVCQTNFAVPPTSYQQQPPVQPQVQPSAQQWPQATNNGPQVRQYQRASRVCKGCGKFCYPRSTCPAFNVKCLRCFRWRHFASVCQTPQAQTPHMPNTQSHNHPSMSHHNSSY